ncbi:MAG: recombinase RecT [Halothiobacillaceae bacterium]
MSENHQIQRAEPSGDTALGFMADAVRTFQGVQQLAEIMAKCGTMPKHLQGQASDCFRVVVQAAKWRMDPFAVAECTSLVHGRLCFEGKLVAAVLRSMGAIEGRLEYDIQGSGQSAKITVTGTPRGGKPVELTGSVAQWKTSNSNWQSMPETMLVYRGTRQWARLYAPEAILGVYTPDEIEEVETREVDAEVVPEPKPAKKRAPVEPVEKPADPPQEEKPKPKPETPKDQAAGLPEDEPREIEEEGPQSDEAGPSVADLHEAMTALWGAGPDGKAAVRKILEDNMIKTLDETSGWAPDARQRIADEINKAWKGCIARARAAKGGE